MTHVPWHITSVSAHPASTTMHAAPTQAASAVLVSRATTLPSDLTSTLPQATSPVMPTVKTTREWALTRPSYQLRVRAERRDEQRVLIDGTGCARARIRGVDRRISAAERARGVKQARARDPAHA